MPRVLRVAVAVVLLAFVSSSAFALEISRAKADELLAQQGNDDPWAKFNDASTLAWNESYTVHALVDLYEATRDAKYLRDAVSRSDRMISHRDDKRNFADSSGVSHKRWSIDSKYAVAKMIVSDAAGKPSIKLRSTLFAFHTRTQSPPTMNAR